MLNKIKRLTNILETLLTVLRFDHVAILIWIFIKKMIKTFMDYGYKKTYHCKTNFGRTLRKRHRFEDKLTDVEDSNDRVQGGPNCTHPTGETSHNACACKYRDYNKLVVKLI